MDVKEAVLSRQSCRAFRSDPVSLSVIRDLLETARWTPSGGNLQPWRVHVLVGKALSDLVVDVRKAMPRNPRGDGSAYDIYPHPLPDPYMDRRRRCGFALYESVGINREDKMARALQMAKNFDFFGAPCGLFVSIEDLMGKPQWSDLGMFVQTFMLLARDKGLHTCPQEAWAAWPNLLRRHLTLSEGETVFCGVALGYMDEEHPINSWRTERAELEDFVTWHGIEP